jgi:hypothetical protein
VHYATNEATLKFGNVLDLALRLGVSPWVAPLVAPAVDPSVLALLLGTRHPAIGGADATVMRPARRLLLFSSVVPEAPADPEVVRRGYGRLSNQARLAGPCDSPVHASTLRTPVAVLRAADQQVRGSPAHDYGAFESGDT